MSCRRHAYIVMVVGVLVVYCSDCCGIVAVKQPSRPRCSFIARTHLASSLGAMDPWVSFNVWTAPSPLYVKHTIAHPVREASDAMSMDFCPSVLFRLRSFKISALPIVSGMLSPLRLRRAQA